MTAAHFSGDFYDFFAALARHQVQYMIVGGEAVIYYGYPRLTGDLDIFYNRTTENSKKLFAALNDFWDNTIPGLESFSELTEENVILQFGAPPNRIDLINTITGVSFAEAWASCIAIMIGEKGEELMIYYIGIECLKKNKEALKRNKDLDDLKYLNSITKP